MKDIISMSLTERYKYQNKQKQKKFNSKTDKVVEDLKREFDIRSCVGIDKYKTTLQDNKHDDFLQHLKEELMDAALYIQKLQSK